MCAVPRDGTVAGEASGESPGILRRLTVPVAVAVGLVVAVAWYVTWATSDLMGGLMAIPSTPAGEAGLGAFFGLMVVMMAAMMLPAALPMILTYHGISRLEGGRPVKRPDYAGTGLFTAPYLLIWAAFGLAAMLGVAALGSVGPLSGASVLLPAAALVAAGAYQMTRTKEVCLRACQSPMSFLLLHWRSGRLGALRMGARHAVYCLGCCWLLMIALFVAGALSFVWMGVLSVVIFAEKVGTRQLLFSRAVGAVLVVLGIVVLVRGLAAG